MQYVKDQTIHCIYQYQLDVLPSNAKLTTATVMSMK